EATLNVALAEFVIVDLPLRLSVAPLHISVPLLMKARVVSVRDVPPPIVVVPLVMVLPVPLIELLFDQLNGPLRVAVPAPVSIPPERLNAPLRVAVEAIASVPDDRVNVSFGLLIVRLLT